MPPYDHPTSVAHEHGLRSTMVTVIAITGGIVGLALLIFLTRRLCDTILAIRALRTPTTRPPPQPSRRGLSVLDSLSGFLVMPFVTALVSWVRARLVRRYANRQGHHHRTGSLRSMESDMRPMLESQLSVISRPGELALPPPAHLASESSHHGRQTHIAS